MADPTPEEARRILAGMNGERGAQGMWDSAIALAKLMHEEIARRRAEKKAASLELRRARYARDKASGEIDRRKAERAARQSTDWEPEPPTGCQCSTCRMPPCGWCESGAEPA